MKRLIIAGLLCLLPSSVMAQSSAELQQQIDRQAIIHQMEMQRQTQQQMLLEMRRRNQAMEMQQQPLCPPRQSSPVNSFIDGWNRGRR